MNTQTKEQTRWISNGTTIARSAQHKDLFIITHANNTWHSVQSTYDIMRNKYPADRARKSRLVAALKLNGNLN